MKAIVVLNCCCVASLLLTSNSYSQLQNYDWYSHSTVTNSVAVGKINNDGLRDLAEANNGALSYVWFNSNQLFTQAFTLDGMGEDVKFGKLRPYTLSKDVATAYRSVWYDNIRIYHNENSTLTLAYSLSAPGVYSLSWGRITAINGCEDLVAVGGESPDVYIYHNDGYGILGNMSTVTVGNGVLKIELANLHET